MENSDYPVTILARMYSGDKSDELSKLLTQILNKVVPNPNKSFIEMQVSCFLQGYADIECQLDAKQESFDESEFNNLLELDFIDKLKAAT